MLLPPQPPYHSQGGFIDAETRKEKTCSNIFTSFDTRTNANSITRTYTNTHTDINANTHTNAYGNASAFVDFNVNLIAAPKVTTMFTFIMLNNLPVLFHVQSILTLLPILIFEPILALMRLLLPQLRQHADQHFAYTTQSLHDKSRTLGRKNWTIVFMLMDSAFLIL